MSTHTVPRFPRGLSLGRASQEQGSVGILVLPRSSRGQFGQVTSFSGLQLSPPSMRVIKVVLSVTGQSVQYLAGCLAHSSHPLLALSVVSLPLRLLPESGWEGGTWYLEGDGFYRPLVLIDGSFGTQYKPSENFSK